MTLPDDAVIGVTSTYGGKLPSVAVYPTDLSPGFQRYLKALEECKTTLDGIANDYNTWPLEEAVSFMENDAKKALAEVQAAKEAMQ